jgi:energy-coupling factor transporter ATP-binding protein EcfA2
MPFVYQPKALELHFHVARALLKQLEEDWGFITEQNREGLVERVSTVCKDIGKLSASDVSVAVVGHTSCGKTTFLSTLTGIDLPISEEANTALPLRLEHDSNATVPVLHFPKKLCDHFETVIYGISLALRSASETSSVLVSEFSTLSGPERDVLDFIRGSCNQPLQEAKISWREDTRFPFLSSNPVSGAEEIVKALEQTSSFVRMSYKLKACPRLRLRLETISPLAGLEISWVPSISLSFLSLADLRFPGRFTIFDTPGSSEAFTSKNDDIMRCELGAIVQLVLRKVDKVLVLGTPSSLDQSPFLNSVAHVRAAYGNECAHRMCVIVNKLDEVEGTKEQRREVMANMKSKLTRNAEIGSSVQEVHGVSARNAKTALTAKAKVRSLKISGIKLILDENATAEQLQLAGMTTQDVQACRTLLFWVYGYDWIAKTKTFFTNAARKTYGSAEAAKDEFHENVQRGSSNLLEQSCWAMLIPSVSDQLIVRVRVAEASGMMSRLHETFTSERDWLHWTIEALKMAMETREVLVPRLRNLYEFVDKQRELFYVSEQNIPEHWSMRFGEEWRKRTPDIENAILEGTVGERFPRTEGMLLTSSKMQKTIRALESSYERV